VKATFDRLARIYRSLEFLAFGGDLERARFALLGRLSRCRSILVLGEGDGRCLQRLVRLAPQARIDCVELSAAMIAQASRRLAPPDRARVRFHWADARRAPLPGGEYDGIATLFFLDCFTPAEVESLVGRATDAAAPGALWLFADFTLPQRGWQRLRARAWLALLYGFFRLTTGLSARRLPPSEAILTAAGWRNCETCQFQAGLLTASLYRRPALIAGPEASP
jgi:SAM-dependent methyltransferase